MQQDPDVVREVPDALQKLIRLIVRGFYGSEIGLLIDVLVRNACVKEEDIQELLKFDKKQLRAMLATLKNDKFLKKRLCVETQPDGKVLRHDYYYINYRSICNVVKYKLHHIHKRIETQERDLTNRASFKCPTCQNTYTDLEVKLLIDPFTGTLNCTYCSAEVEEDVSAEAAKDSRTLQARFNEQMGPIYKLLEETENVRLSLEVLEPEPTIIPHLHPNAKPNESRQRHIGERQGGYWADAKTPGVDYHQDVVINIGDHPDEDKVAAKEVPIWIQQSTIGASDATSAAISSISGGSSSHVHERVTDSSSQETKKDNDEVLAMLMMQERGSKSNHAAATSSRRYSDDNRSDTSESGGEGGKKNKENDDEDDDDDDFEEVDDDDPIVVVAGKQYSYSEVANKGQELVQLMTAEEKARYIEIGQRMYEDMDH